MEKPGFVYLNHTSEEKFQAFGETLEEAFYNAALAVTNLMTDVSKVKKRKEFEVRVKADSLEALLYDFLNELLFLLDSEGVFVSGFKDLVIEKARGGEKGGYSLRAKALGDDARKYEKKGDVKAPTYDEMLVERRGCEWVVQAVVDV